MGRTGVVHVSAYFPPHLGGTEVVVAELAAEQHRRGRPVRVLTSDIGADGADPSYVRRLHARDVAHTPVAVGLPWALYRTPDSWVIHLHIAQAYLPEAVSLVARLRRIPYVAHLHLDAPASGPAGALLKAYKPLVLARVLRRAGRVVVFSEVQRDEVVADYRVRPESVAVVPNGVAERFVLPDRPASRPLRLLFVGRLGPAKNLVQLLDALDGVSERFLTDIVGDGELRAELEAHARRLGLSGVIFHGRLDGVALGDVYRSAGVFVMPSVREGMPLALLEAMASGLPVVATDVVGLRDVVEDGRTGVLVPLGDPVALRRALVALSDDERRRRAMAAAAHAQAVDRTWAAVADRMDEVYEAARH